MEKYKMDCGCEFRIIDPTIKEWDGLPHLDIDIENPNYNCEGTWNLFSEGNTKGVFQLETFLGKEWSSKIKPHNEEELSALGALLRPGCTRSGTTEKFADRKNLKEEIVPIDPSIADILEPTYQLIVYQEQSMKVAQRVAGFNLQKADILRRAMGKKDSALMAKVGTEFMEGCKNTGLVSEEKAKEIWDCIKRSERYSFNKCLTGDTLIFVDGFIPTKIVDLKPGQKILAPNNKLVIVKNIYHNGYRRICKLILNNNLSIRCTINHKFKTKNGIQTLEEIYNSKDCKRGYPENSKILCQDGEYHSVLNIDFGTQSGTNTDNNYDYVYDIEVDSNDHLYIANGIVTHNSHSLSYAILGYWTAYLKYHFPKHFFRAWLTYAKEKIKPKEEIKALVANSRKNDIEIYGPKIQNIKNHSDFAIINNEVYFGARNVKNVGDSKIKDIINSIVSAEHDLDKPLEKFSWLEFLVYISPKISTNVITNLILVGSMSIFGNNRQELLFQYDIFTKLTDREIEIIKKNNVHTIPDALKVLLNKVNINRKTNIEGLLNLYNNPTSDLVDNPLWIIKQEEELLGTPISLSLMDTCDKMDSDTTCEEFSNGKGGTMILSAEIKGVRESKVKNGPNAGQTMGFLSIGDSSGEINNVVVFSGEWEKYKSMLYPENIVTIVGERTKTGSLMVKVVKQL